MMLNDVRLIGNRQSIFVFGLCAWCLLSYPGESFAKNAPDLCAAFKTPETRKQCWKALYKAADKRLNAVYRALRKRLPLAEKTEMKKDSRAWIRYKDYQCGFVASMQHRNTKRYQDTETYFSCLHGYTLSRVRYLRRAFGKKGVSTSTIDGEYQDTFGGSMTLTSKGEKLHFKIDVVRGPSHHLGSIKGIFQRQGGEGLFRSGGSDPHESCEIKATFRPLRIQLKATGCRSYMGARAYFDGLYRKVK